MYPAIYHAKLAGRLFRSLIPRGACPLLFISDMCDFLRLIVKAPHRAVVILWNVKCLMSQILISGCAFAPRKGVGKSF